MDIKVLNLDELSVPQLKEMHAVLGKKYPMPEAKTEEMDTETKRLEVARRIGAHSVVKDIASVLKIKEKR